MDIDREHVQTLFDIATGSLDFGSGFLVDDEVEHLRAVAVALGVDPSVATPHNYKTRYPHPFKPCLSDDGEPPTCREYGDHGRTCNRNESDPIHTKENSA